MSRRAIRRITELDPRAVLAHANWSVDALKRWVAHAARTAEGDYVALAPEPVSALEDFFDRLAAGAGAGETVLAGFDFPLGLPAAYAAAAGIDHFIPALARFGRGRWAEFHDPAAASGEISIDVKHCFPVVFGEFCRAVSNVADEHCSVVTT